MENTIKPHFSFNEQSLNVFDKLMDLDLGLQFEGALADSIWIYRKSKNLFVSIQVGFGGVRFVKVNYTDSMGSVKETNVDMTEIDSPIKLLKKLKVILTD